MHRYSTVAEPLATLAHVVLSIPTSQALQPRKNSFFKVVLYELAGLNQGSRC